MTGPAICGLLVQGLEFPEHLRSHHDVGGPDKAELVCRWNGCFAVMKTESLMRHLREKHLEFKYACPNCPEKFTRQYTLQCHMSRKHSVEKGQVGHPLAGEDSGSLLPTMVASAAAPGSLTPLGGAAKVQVQVQVPPVYREVE